MKKIYSLLLLAVALVCLPMGVRGDELTVADGTYLRQELPVHGYNCDAVQHNQFIFLANELSEMKGADISALKFYLEKASYNWSKAAPNATFRFAEVEATTVNSLITVDESFTEVYSGQIVFASGEWNIELNTPYHYNGGNLLIDVQTTAGGYVNSNSNTGSRFYSAEADYRGNYNGTVKYYVPKTTFTYELAVTGSGLKVLDGSTKISTGYNYSFGLATAGTTKTFTLSNPGTEATPVAVSHTGSFGAELSAASIPAGGEVTLTVTMPATTGEDVITISSTAEGIDNFVINVSGTIRDASKLYETLLGGSIPEDWTTSGGTWSWSTTNGASNTAWYETSNYRLITPQLIVAEGEKFFFEAQGTYDGYQGVKFEYSADGSTWTASATETAVTGEWQTFEINDVPAGKYYIALHGWHVNIRNFYGGTLPAKVKDVAAAGVTDTEATISWTAHGSETAWQVSYSTTSGDPNNGTIVNATSTSKVLEVLSATTTYYVSVRIGNSGEWSNEISFKTGCAALSGSWSLNFDELESGQIPECWDNSGSTSATYATTPSYFWTAYKYSYDSDAKMLKMNNTMIQTGTAVINTPRIELPASPAYEFNFEYSHKADCGALIVKVSEDGGANWTDLGSYTNETGGTAGVPADLIEASIDLSSYAGKTIMLQFYAMADYGSGAIFVDNVAVRVKSNCALPKNVTVSSITDHTASVAWTQKGEVSAWKLQTSTDGENWGEEIEANANPFTLSGLNAETTYYVRVKAACGESEYSDWSDASAAFTTLCEAKTLPFATEEFDAIPSCWSVDSEWSIYTYEGHSNSTSIRVKSYTASLTMPLIELSEKAQLSFYLSGNSSAKCYVYVNDGESEEKAGEIYASTSWKQATVDLSAYTGKTVNIIFRSSTSSYYLYLDDVAVNYLPVAAPTNVATTPANESAVVTWESEEATFALRYRTNGEGDWTEVADLSAKTYTIEGLTNGTAYEVQVKAVASANRQSDWTASAVVTPMACPTVTGIELSEKTFKSVKVSWTASGTGTWVLEYGLNAPYTVVENLAVTEYVLDNLTPGETYTIKVHPNCSEESLQTSYYPAYTAPSNVVVTNISDVTATASWDAVADATLGYTYSVAPRGNQTPWAYSKIVTNETSVELSGLAGGSDYDFYVVTNYPDDYKSPAIKVEFSTITVAPKSISVSDITASSAKLTWENDGAATAYEYAVGNDPTALEWNEVAEKTKTLSELEANTSYTFYVRSKYSDEVKSDSVNITFRTECESIVVDAENPFTENFNSLTQVVTIPECWDNAEGTTTSDNYKWRYYSDGHDGACVRFESDYNAKGATNVLATPTIQLDVEATLKFWCKNAKGGAFEVKISANGGERETLLSGLTSISSWTEKEVDLSAYTGKSVVLYFCGTSNYATGGLICLDDVNITAIPACGTPKNVQATNVLCNTATITWEKGGKETAWIVEYATNEDFTEGLVEKNADATSVALTGLTTNTKYYVRVKGDCESATYSEVINFTPAYIAPSDVAVTEITTASAQVDWTPNSGETIWTIQYKKAADAEWTNIENVDAHPYVLTNLAAGTNYQVRVLAGEVASSNESFSTGCAAITALPWSENFEGHPLNAAPACWEVVDPNNTKIYVSTGSTWFDLGTTGLFFEGAKANYGYILLPEFEAALNTLQISFSHSEESSSSSGKIELGYYKDDEFTSLKVYDQSQKAWKAEGPFALTDVPAGARLAFGYKTNSNTYAAAIDNITIEEIPACAVPTDLAASEVTAATATLSWTSEAANFKVQYTTDKANWGEEHAVAATTLALEDLTEQTTYYARVKAICGEASESKYCEEISFTTPCAVKSMPYAESFEDGVPACWASTGSWTTNSEYAHSGNALRADVKNKVATLTMPAIAISEADAELVFYVRNVYSGSYYVSGEVIITPTEGEAKHIGIINSNDINNKQKVDLSEFNGKDVVISFSISSVSSSAYVSIDEVTVAKKQCATPTDLTAQVASKSATISWTAGDDETAWQLQYKASSAENWTLVENISSLSYQITGLTNGTEYVAQVRAYCDETHQSEWSESVVFTPSIPSALDNSNAANKAVKLIENDQIIIIRDGVKYNAQGQKLN